MKGARASGRQLYNDTKGGLENWDRGRETDYVDRELLLFPQEDMVLTVSSLSNINYTANTHLR